MRRPRDNQKARLYKAERTLAEWTYEGGDPRLSTTKKIQAYVDRLTTYAWFEKQFGTNWKVRVYYTRSKRTAWGEYTGSKTGYIQIPVWGQSELVVLHEVAHAINLTGDRHGPRFVARYVLLVEKKMGVEVADRLRAACRAHNVDWTWRKP